MDLACGILIGGLSVRMGRPKALMPVDGMTLLERTVRIARSAISDVMLIGHPPFELPDPLRRLPLIADAPPGCGPIGGLAGFFNAQPETDCMLLACDMPNLNAELLRRLRDAAVEDVDAVVPQCLAGGNSVHPCCAMYRSTAATSVFEAVGARQFAMQGLLDRLHIRWISLNESEASWVANMNTPDDVVRNRGVGE